MLVLFAGLALALAQGDAAADEHVPATNGASSGVFTEAQAERGAEVFANSCAGCHGAELGGGFGPQLAPIGEHWHDATVGSLFAFVNSAMPFDAPGSLEPQQYADVIAFVLSANGFPSGTEELAPDRAALDGLVIDASALGGQ